MSVRLTRGIWHSKVGHYATLSHVGCLLKCFEFVLGYGAFDDEICCVLASIRRPLGRIDCIVAEYVPVVCSDQRTLGTHLG